VRCSHFIVAEDKTDEDKEYRSEKENARLDGKGVREEEY
jgi:hypothetical protein